MGRPGLVHACVCIVVIAQAPFVTSAGQAASRSYLDETDLLGDIPIVTAGTRLKQKITDTPTAITIIDRQTIAASGATEIPQLFNLVPGFLSYYVLGNQFGVTNRGLTIDFPGDLEVMINGRSVYEPLFSTVEWSSLGITVDDIQSIEVVRGSNAPAHGSNAFLGAINIITVPPLQASGTRFNSTIGDLHTRNGSLRYAGEAGAAHYTLGVSYRNNAGFPAVDSRDPNRGNRVIDGNEALHANVEAMFSPSLNDSVELRLGLGSSNVAVPDFGLGSELDEHERKGFSTREFDSSYQQILWKHSLQSGAETQLHFYHNRLRIDEALELGFLTDIFAPLGLSVAQLFNGHADEFIVTGLDDALSERYDMEFQHSLNLSNKQQLVWGVGTRLDRLRSKDLLDRKATEAEVGYRLFANWAAQFGAGWATNVGFMLEHNDIGGTYISPRVGLNLTLRPDHVIRLAATGGNRTPSIVEANQQQIVRFSDGVVIDSVNLRPEDVDLTTLTEYELGYFGRFFSDRLTADLRVFRAEVDDGITAVVVPAEGLDGNARRLTNALEWTTKGFDGQLRWQASDRTLISVQYAYTDFDGQRVRNFDPLDVRELSRELPRHNASVLLSHRILPQLSASVSWYYLSDLKWLEGDFVEQHERLDLRVAYDFRLGHANGEIELLGHNIFDDFLEYQDSNIFERRWFIAVSFDLP
ncbi:MAG: TonB-dependent receptor plug domain-containing protein [Pseudomonadales bacterium]